MIGIRNRLAHACFATEQFILHEIATKLLPPLLPRLPAIADEADQAPPHSSGVRSSSSRFSPLPATPASWRIVRSISPATSG